MHLNSLDNKRLLLAHRRRHQKVSSPDRIRARRSGKKAIAWINGEYKKMP